MMGNVFPIRRIGWPRRAQIRLGRAKFRLFQAKFELFRDIWSVFSSRLGGETAIFGWK